jgi:cytidine deaminase
MDASEIDWEQLLQCAMIARKHAYAPYSQFAVGAALLASDDTVYVGCNIENASYGASNCAERTALFSAITAGEQAGSFRALVVIADTAHEISPCGICRQVLAELCPPEMPVLMANLKGARRTTTAGQLMPFAFDRQQLLSEGNENVNE